MTMSGVAIGLTNKIKILGLTIDDKLTFNEHVSTAELLNRTVSLNAALALSETLPLDPRIIEVVYRTLLKSEQQQRYADSKLGLVTKVFLPDIESAYKFVKQKRPDRNLVHFMTVQGPFASYLKIFNLKRDPSCRHAGNVPALSA
ncbi:unnamed protein product [Pieris brassicae]|uniref:Uncharacterized protein n=1 Tax=Pieris brassicae TaxID=7116 RepID=A0A9P0T9V7_PIEBR|nr:unnamed protein product [Pieris brassicae]